MPSIILLILLSLPAFAEPAKYLGLIGGGMEPQKNAGTIFDDDIPLVGNFGKKAGYETTAIFNGGHPATESLLTSHIGPTPPFAAASFEKMIADYETKIKSGTIKSGDQLLLIVHTHGAKRGTGKDSNEATHGIGFGIVEGTMDYTTLGTSGSSYSNPHPTGTVTLDRLKTLATLADQKGVKLAIVDSSCHSGGSIALGTPNTCVVSSTGYNNLGYSNFSPDFLKRFKAGKSLEEVFLQTRERDYTPAFPMISSPVGVDLQNELYPLVDNFMYSYGTNDANDKIMTMLYDQVETNTCEEADAKFSELMVTLAGIEKRFKDQDIGNPKFTALKSALTQYHDLQKTLRDHIKTIRPADFTKQEKFCGPPEMLAKLPASQPGCFMYSPKQMLTTDFSHMIKIESEKAAVETDSFKQIMWASRLNQWNQIIARQNVLKSNPVFSGYADYLKNIPDLQKKTYSLATNVSKELKKIYQLEYEERAKKDKRPNPCRDFKL